MSKLWATITKTTVYDVELEAPDDMSLEELNDLADEGELLDTCAVLNEDNEGEEICKTYIYNFNGQPVEHEEKNNGTKIKS